MSDTEDRKVVDASPAEGDEDTIVEIAEDGEVPSSAGNTGGSAKPSLSAMVDDLDAMVRGTGGAASGGASQAIVQSTDEDKCSIHIGSVDYATTPQELATLFEDCGKVKLVTIATDKFSNRPKGYAYLQFEEQSAVAAALGMNGTELHGRAITVQPKRTNMPGYARGRGRGRGRGGFRGGRGRGRGGFRGRGRGGPRPY